MPFESLAYRYTFLITDLPHRWLPLIHLYDPDLPLFPIYYFHVLADVTAQRPADVDRAFGYVEKINLVDEGGATVTLVLNKDLSSFSNHGFIAPVENEVRERLGIVDPVRHTDLQNAFGPPYAAANAVLTEIWHRVVVNAYGNLLPFGRLWDEVLGLARFIASWYSPSGRKGELIQTHYFASRFGVRIQSAGSIPQVDYFLLPTIHELKDRGNPLTSFPNYAALIHVAHLIQTSLCSLRTVGGVQFSTFSPPSSGQFTAVKMQGIINSGVIPQAYKLAATECFNAFDKGAQRPIIFFMMLDDIRQGRLDPARLTSAQCGSIYDGLGKSYQAPKVIEIYAQQSAGNNAAMPIDTWVRTFLKSPLNVYPRTKSNTMHHTIFSNSQSLGRWKDLFGFTAQARKVHSSACDDALWCLKYGANDRDFGPRGANPFACNICLDNIRNRCPAYAQIRGKGISFNGVVSGADFIISTSAGNNTTPGQTFTSCSGMGTYGPLRDEFSPADDPNGFARFPDPAHPGGGVITVDDFVRIY
jgi:hypothetical protein